VCLCHRDILFLFGLVIAAKTETVFWATLNSESSLGFGRLSYVRRELHAVATIVTVKEVGGQGVATAMAGASINIENNLHEVKPYLAEAEFDHFIRREVQDWYSLGLSP
jgi:hypothetical protein